MNWWRVLVKVAGSSIGRWRTGAASDEDARLMQALLESGALSNRHGVNEKCDAFSCVFVNWKTRFRSPPARLAFAMTVTVMTRPFFRAAIIFIPARRSRDGFSKCSEADRSGGAQSGRLELAREVTRRENPLTARVMVNRIWQHLTGRGLVATPDNFGKMGAQPTHPELLDYLATRFMDEGWSVKRLIREIVSSRTFSLSSTPCEGVTERDPTNDYLSHARVVRLEAEAIRDTLLAVAGNLKLGHEGPRRARVLQDADRSGQTTATGSD
jgi:hypothetical protein